MRRLVAGNMVVIEPFLLIKDHSESPLLAHILSDIVGHILSEVLVAVSIAVLDAVPVEVLGDVPGMILVVLLSNHPVPDSR